MKQKKIYLEILRTLAIILVIYNHTRGNGYTLYQNTSNIWTYYSSLTLSIFCKIAVPLFFMISGVTLLGKTESVRSVYLKRVARIVLVILLFTLLQYARILRVHPENGFSILTYIAYCYSGNIIEPYWFLKSYLSMLLILPILRLIAQNLKKEHIYLLLGLKVFSSLTTAIVLHTGYSMNISLVTNTDFIFYPLIGYYFGNIEFQKISPHKRMVYSSLAIIALTIMTSVLSTIYYQHIGTYSEDLNAIIIWAITLLVFLFFKEINIRNERIGKLWITLGECTFGLYLIEDVVRNQIEKLLPFFPSIFGPMTSCLCFVFLSTIVGLFIIWLVRKLPYVNKLI